MQRSARKLLEAFLGVEFHTQTIETEVVVAASEVILVAPANVARVRLQIGAAGTTSVTAHLAHSADLAVSGGYNPYATNEWSLTLWDDFDDVTLPVYCFATTAGTLYVRQVILTGLGPDQVP